MRMNSYGDMDVDELDDLVSDEIKGNRDLDDNLPEDDHEDEDDDSTLA